MYRYREIFKQAAKVAFKYPVIWFFGLLAALLGTSGEAEVFFSSYANSGWLTFWQALANGGLVSAEGIRGLTKVFFDSPLFVAVFALASLVVLGLTVFITWLVVIAQTAVIGQSVAITRKHPLRFAESFGLGVSKFWPVFGINVLLKLIIWLVISLIGLAAILRIPFAIYIFVIVFNVGMVLVLISSFISRYAICAVVLRDKGFVDSFKLAWKLFKANWLMSFEISIILFLINWLVNIISGWLGLLLIFYTLRLYSEWLFGTVLLTVLLFAAFIIIQIVLTIFSWAAWSIVFEIIASKKNLLVSRLMAGWQVVRRQK